MGYYGSVSMDLMLNIFTSTDSQFRKNHYEKLIRAYHSSLSDMVQKLGSNPNNLFSFDDLQAQLKVYGSVNLIRATVLLAFFVANPEDITDFDEYTDLIKRGKKARLLKTKFNEETKPKYSLLINDLVTDFVNYGYVTTEQE